jgi:hypothetical protein
MVSSPPRAMSKEATTPPSSTSLRRYFFLCPNIIFDLELSSLDLALYLVIRRTAGDDGVCWRNTRSLAEMAGMSVGSVCKAKRILSQPFLSLNSKPLIEIRKERNRGGGKPRDIITLTNIWAANEKRYSSSKSLGTDESRSVGDLGNSRSELASSTGEIKKNTVRKLNEEISPSLSPSVRETKRESVAFSEFWNFLCRIFKRTDKRQPTRAEKKLMLRLLPISPDEYEVVKWWMALDEHRYDFRQGIGFALQRRPTSVGLLLRRWGDVNDIARRYLKELQSRGYIY